MLVFLGGTVGNNPWRSHLQQALSWDSRLFNPVVADWNEAAQAAEEQAKAEADLFVFYISNPLQEGLPISAYSLVEATMALYDAPSTTVVVFETNDVEGHSLKAIKQAEKILRARFPEAHILGSYSEMVDWLKQRL